ncbi:ABC transporter ATP-binding protein [Ureaplasma ceti]|uniref:ABC transporter ATP-binding protein n=1 Tax=Ureaplasma ceti TaxID=3119530 RepID=A0ABP9U6W2_9BACT
MSLRNRQPFVSPNQQLSDQYNELIQNNPEKFFYLLDHNQIQTNCLSPKMEKIIKRRRRMYNKKEAREAIRTIFSFIRDYKAILIFLIISTICITVLNSLATFGLKSLTQLVALSQIPDPHNPHVVDIDWSNFNVLSVYAIVLLVFYLVMAFLMWLQNRYCIKLSQNIGYKIRQKLFKKIQKLPVKYFDQNSSGDLMSKFTNDINNVTNGLSQNIATLLNAMFMAVSMLISMFLMSAYLALITLALLPLIFVPIMFITRKSQPLFKQTQSTLGEMNGFVEEMVSGQNIITLFNEEELANEKFEQINKKLNNVTKRSQGMSSIIFPYTNFFTNLVTMAVTVIGIVFVIKGISFAGVTLPNVQGAHMPPASQLAPMQAHNAQMIHYMSGIAVIATFTIMASAFLRPFAQVGNISNLLQMALAGANRAFTVFKEMDEVTPYEHVILSIALEGQHDAKRQADLNELSDAWSKETEAEDISNKKVSELMDGINIKPFQKPEYIETDGSVKVENLNFSYVKDKQILHDINIDVKQGQTIAIVGPTGSGKSTFINLLTKFYDIEDGDILMGGSTSIKSVTKESMRNNVSIVLQDTYLFNESIKTNIGYGNMKATDEEIIQAAKIANAHNFIMQLPHGYDTVLTDNGESLSQGQRQLLAIARAALAPSNVLILDEATSSIDTKTELEIQNAMLRLMKNKTSFVIAHRLSTIQNADQILVLKDGHIIERGTHQELLDAEGFYAQLFNSQFYGEQDI